MGFTKHPLKLREKEKDSDRWETCFHNGFRLQPIVMVSDGTMGKCRGKNGCFVRFIVDFDKNECITRVYDEKSKKDPSAFNLKGEKTWEMKEEVDIIPAMSSRNSHIIEIRLGPVEYRR